MNKQIAETYEEYLAGAEQVAGFGRLSCYQGLRYLEKYIQEDKNYTEELEDSLVFIISHIKRIEKENTKLKQALNEIRDKLLKLNDKFKSVSGIPFDITEIVEMIEIIDKVGGNGE